MNSEKITIQTRTLDTSPVYNKFSITPKFAPQLKNQFISFSWESSRRDLVVVVKETSYMEVYKWIQCIKDAHKTPFIDLDQNSLVLAIKNELDNDVALIKFKTLSLEKSTCVFSTQECGSKDDSKNLVYRLELSYEEEELLEEKGILDMPKITPNEATDAEWSDDSKMQLTKSE